MKFTTFVLLIAALAAADNWAVIVGGSKGYGNYRHQANIAHQYHQYLEFGVKPEHIIVFDYDDVAEHKSNPFPGKLYNTPGEDAREYYEGLVIDYKGKDVNKKNFLNCLLGEETGFKVLKSTSEDNVFINYYDHGGNGLIAMINEYVYKDELQDTLKKMAEQKMFKQLVLYLEACDSATMMEGFPDNLNIYVVTSTDAAVSGWACFCPPDEDVTHGKHIGACLSEEFGYNYMKDMDENAGKDNFSQQFKAIYDGMKKSKPKQWADMSFQTETLAEFFGKDKKIVKPSQLVNAPTAYQESYDTTLNWLQYEVSRKDVDAGYRNEMMKEYEEQMKISQDTDRFYRRLVSRLGKKFDDMMVRPEHNFKNAKCYVNAVQRVSKRLPYSDYGMKYFVVLGNLCDSTKLAILPF